MVQGQDVDKVRFVYFVYSEHYVFFFLNHTRKLFRVCGTGSKVPYSHVEKGRNPQPDFFWRGRESPKNASR